MVYKAEQYHDPDSSHPEDVESFRVSTLEIDIAEIPSVLEELRATHRNGLGARVASIAMMHMYVVDGTDESPRPVLLDGEAARQVRHADETVRLHPEELLIGDTVHLYTHDVDIDSRTGDVVETGYYLPLAA